MTQRLDPLEIVNTPPPEEDPRPSTPKYSGVNVGLLERARLEGDGFGVSQEFVKADQAQRSADRENQAFMFGIGEDLRQEQAKGGAPRFVETALGDVQRSNLASGGTADLGQYVDQGTANRLQQMGLQGVYEQDMYKGYKYNPNTGQYDYYDNTPSLLEQLAPELVKGAILGVATGGMGGFLSNSLGVSANVGKALASAGFNAMFGDTNLEDTIKGVASAYGLEQLTELSDVVATGSDFLDGVLKDSVGSIVKGKDPGKAVLTSILKQGAESASDFFDLGDTEDSILAGLSDFDKEYLQPVKNAVEEALGVDFSEAYDAVKGDVDELLAVVPDEVKDLVEGFAKYKLQEALGGTTGTAQGGGQMIASAPTISNPLLEVKSPELTQYESLDNNLLQQLRI